MLQNVISQNAQSLLMNTAATSDTAVAEKPAEPEETPEVNSKTAVTALGKQSQDNQLIMEHP